MGCIVLLDIYFEISFFLCANGIEKGTGGSLAGG